MLQLTSKIENVFGAILGSSLKALSTGCAEVAECMHRTTHRIVASYYQLTASVPRKMPTTDAEHYRMLLIIQDYFGLELRSDVVLTMYGQLLSSPITTKRFTYKKLVTAGERLLINAFINNKKGVEIEKLKARMKEIAEKMVEEDKPVVPQGSHDIPREMPELHRASDSMVHAFEGDGVY